MKQRWVLSSSLPLVVHVQLPLDRDAGYQSGMLGEMHGLNWHHQFHIFMLYPGSQVDFSPNHLNLTIPLNSRQGFDLKAALEH